MAPTAKAMLCHIRHPVGGVPRLIGAIVGGFS